MSEHVESGGLRWGQSFWRAGNISWPFATIRISPERIQITAKFWNIVDLAFDFKKSELKALRRKCGLFSVGVQLEHEKVDYQPYILFWSAKPKTLIAELRRLGYEVSDAPE